MSTKKEKSEAAFREAYASLNAAQKQAVDSIEGPVMVIAGPGTGKTQVLTLRIANILLSTDTPAESILALTFTESGAAAMRDRLRQYIGSRAYQVAIYTFHGFAQRLIGDYPDAYPRVVGGRPASELEKVSIVEDIINAGEVRKLRPMGDPSYYIRPIVSIIGKLKQEYIRPDDLAAGIAGQEDQLAKMPQFHEKGAHRGKVRGEYTKLSEVIEKNRELLHIYRRYEAALATARLYDFEDMIVETVTALSDNQSMLRDLQELCLYILADEHQDVNGAQNRILDLLAAYHEYPNLFVVGDEKQAIFRFQGASLDNFLYFQNRYPDTRVISLTENYRSGQEILDVAHSLVAVTDGPLRDLRLPLQAAAVTKSEVVRSNFSQPVLEDAAIVSSVQEQLATGVKASEIALIVRTNREVEVFSSLLRQSGLSVKASADSDILDHPLLHTVEALLSLVQTAPSEGALFTVLHGPFTGINAADLFKLVQARNFTTPLISLIGDRKKLEELGVADIEAVLAVATLIEVVRARAITEAPHRLLQYLMTESGLLDFVMVNDPLEGGRVLRRLYDEVESLVVRERAGLTDVAKMFKQLRQYRLPLNAPYLNLTNDAVSVMTAHKSKGLEFSVVYLPHLQDTTWGGKQQRSYFSIPIVGQTGIDDALDDERRLFYVALTRAKTKLFLSTSALATNGRPAVPSRLLEQLESGLITVAQAEEDQFDISQGLQSFEKPLDFDLTLLRSTLAERGFSATSFNNYLENPWHYFYRNVLRIPEVQDLSLQFGTIAHSVLEFATRTHTATGTLPTISMLKNKLEASLGRLPLGPVEYSSLLEKGLDMLAAYLPHLEATLPKTTREELKLRVLLPTGLAELPELPLTGSLDRVDIADDGSLLRVVDYKTGKAKNRNQIEGKTANSDGNYKRQLVFYALLLSLQNEGKNTTRTGTLSFVEPDQKGVIREETFEITETEITALKSELLAATEDILAGKFLTDQVAAKTSQYAHLADRFLP